MSNAPVPGHDMPPDPWAEEGVDLWALETAEDLASRGVDSNHPAWQDLDSGLEIGDFDDRPEDAIPQRPGRSLRAPRWVAYAGYTLLALLVVFALLLVAIR